MNNQSTMLAGAYFGAGNVKTVQKPIPELGLDEVVIKVMLMPSINWVVK